MRDLRIGYIHQVGKVVLCLMGRDGSSGTGRIYWVESAEERVKSWGRVMGGVKGRRRMKKGVVRVGQVYYRRDICDAYIVLRY